MIQQHVIDWWRHAATQRRGKAMTKPDYELPSGQLEAIRWAIRAFPDATRWKSEPLGDRGPTYWESISGEIEKQNARIAELEAALGEVERWTVGMEDDLLYHIFRTARAALQQESR